MTNYEMMYIIDPTLDEETKKAMVAKVEEIISAEGEVVESDIWGMRKLAYPIEKKNEGYYVVVTFKAETDFPKEIDRRLKISDAFIRHMIINKDAE